MRNRKGAIGAMALVAVASMFFGEEVFAANGWEEDLKLVTASTSSQTDASVQLTMGGKRIEGTLNAANASANPDEAGKVLTEIATITVGNTDGYTVAVSGNANLTGERDSSHTIPSVNAAKTLGSMSNEWGYYGVLGDTEASWNPSTSFKAMTNGQQTVGTGDATTSNVTKTVTLFYGARVNDSIAEDFYGNTVTLSVVAQPRTVTTAITTMQAFDATTCGKLNEHETLQLTDTRDNKKYWVTKMLDGNCWMSQNLDLDITTTNITTASSDVTANWTSSSTYPARATTTSLTTGSTSYTETYSWDLGQYVINAPTKTDSCGRNDSGLSECTMFTDVTGWTASDDPNFYKNNNGSSVNAATKTYDAHYLVGNYYQWNAATAGTGGTLDKYTTAPGSVCPKGWSLPRQGSTTKGTFGYMLSQYGVQSKVNIAEGAVVSPVNGKEYDIALSPLFLVRGGWIWTGYSTPFRDAGNYGRYWLSDAWLDAGFAYNLHFVTIVHPFDYNNRYDGFSLRCLIPTS